MTSAFLYKIGLVPSPSCSFCGKENESLENILIYCNYAKEFRAEANKWLCTLKVDINNKVIMYSCRCKITFPKVKVFMSRLRKIQNLGLVIAKSKNKLSFHTAKWGKFDL